MADATRERAPMQLGIDPQLADVMGALTFDSNELAVGGLADANVTIMGFRYQAGGETRTREARGNQGPEQYVTPDQMVMSLRVDNFEEIGSESDEATQYLTLPKAFTVNGQPRRGKLTKQSTYGLFLIHLEQIGVSSNVEAASEVLIEHGLPDLIGLQFRRELLEFEGFNGQGTRTVHLPTQLYGYDNDVRLNSGVLDEKGQPLEPRYTRSQRQAMETAPTTAVSAAAVPSRRAPVAANA